MSEADVYALLAEHASVLFEVVSVRWRFVSGNAQLLCARRPS